ncbi:monooxygenase family protein [Mangrovibrevibacter kandeliae]|uniref:monooxygenase family protein n=1 Tax=Mangrovibrevibacter kandeliae TaxID=2968473 RepID=UPI0021177802|nr:MULTISPECIES: phenylacetaldoxime dehydratase family protein [unclassified Aurantimonas]MCQ8784136.1 DUF4188 domain-containing protein [Aurantimonas sp. CSK15Z-1]MCW4116855.1 DUF4188 domain-containing protein [Aurantimonas sp. MSK8Z-1]
MQDRVNRQSVDLTAYPDLVVVILGLKVRTLRGLVSMLGIGRGLAQIQGAPPDGLLGHEQLLFGWNHLGMRQYWRDLDSLERFTRSEPHAAWWRDFLRDSGGAGFWHETYSARRGIEAVYVDMPSPVGLARFAPERRPVGPFLSARGRLRGGMEREVA